MGRRMDWRRARKSGTTSDAGSLLARRAARVERNWARDPEIARALNDFAAVTATPPMSAGRHRVQTAGCLVTWDGERWRIVRDADRALIAGPFDEPWQAWRWFETA